MAAGGGGSDVVIAGKLTNSTIGKVGQIEKIGPLAASSCTVGDLEIYALAFCSTPWAGSANVGSDGSFFSNNPRSRRISRLSFVIGFPWKNSHQLRGSRSGCGQIPDGR
jgi:hypothetical protein